MTTRSIHSALTAASGTARTLCGSIAAWHRNRRDERARRRYREAYNRARRIYTVTVFADAYYLARNGEHICRIPDPALVPDTLRDAWSAYARQHTEET
jgi:hypothetical protein